MGPSPPPDEAALVSAIGDELRRAGRPADLSDDCAFLRGATQLVTTDTLIEGVHFQLDLDTLAQVGAQAAVQNLSDLAASGGGAGWLVWSLCLPPNLRTLEAVRALTRGFAETAAQNSATVVGGNLSRMPGPLTVAVTAGGPLAGKRPLTRSGALPGDGVYLTGALGDAALGVVEPTPAHRAARHAWRPHLAEAAILANDPGVTACMDISDGLLLDGARLAKASGVSLAVESGAVPLGPACAAVGERHRNLALRGGEDYVLLFTARSCPVGLKAWRIGEIRAADPAGALFLDGRPERPGGFDHFVEAH